MPLSGVRYRVKSMPNGQKVRLAFQNGTNKVVEAVPLPTKKLRDKVRQRKRYGRSV